MTKVGISYEQWKKYSYPSKSLLEPLVHTLEDLLSWCHFKGKNRVIFPPTSPEISCFWPNLSDLVSLGNKKLDPNLKTCVAAPLNCFSMVLCCKKRTRKEMLRNVKKRKEYDIGFALAWIFFMIYYW